MTDTRKTQLEIGATDNTGPAFESVKHNATDAARSVTTSATQASKAVDDIGKSARGAEQGIGKATGGIVASIKRQVAELERLKIEQEAGRRGTAAYYEALAKLRGASPDILRPYLEQLRKAEEAQKLATNSLDKMGLSAKQTAAALRQVPAQFTDIVTGLAGGQNPLTVLLQQGGQLKDVFGGAGAAARALGGYVLGLVNPITVVLGAAAGVVAAFASGQREIAEYGKALALSGNAAGATAGQLQDMARRLSAVAGTQGETAEAVQAVARSGSVAASNIELVAGAAVRFSKATGQSVAETVKQFQDLANSPADTLVKLNQQYNFLTASTYAQVKALEEAGDKTKAADLAQKAFADTLQVRSVDVLQNLGLFERGWKNITEAIKGAVDAAKDIGRAQTPGQQFESLQAQIAIREQQIATGDPRATGLGAQDRFRARLREEIAALQAQAAAIGGVAAAKAFEAEEQRKSTNAQREAVEAIGRVDKITESAATKQERLNKALKEYRADIDRIRAANANDPRLDPAAIAKNEANIRAQFSETAKPAKMDAEALEVARRYKDVVGDLTKLQQDAAIKNEGLSRAMARLHLEMANPIFAKYNAAQQEEIVTLAFLADAEDRVGETRKRNAKEAEAYEAAMKKEADAINAVVEANIRAVFGVTRRAQDSAKQAEFEAQAYGLTKSAVLELHIAEKQRALDALRAGQTITEQLQREIDLRQQEIDAIKKEVAAVRNVEVRQATDKAAEQAAQEWRRAAEQIEQSLTDALLRGFESGKGFAQNLRDTVANMFKTLVLRPVVSAVVSPVAAGITNALGVPGAASSFAGNAAGSAASSYLGGSIFGSSAAYGAAIGTTSIGAGSQAAMLASQTGVFGLEGAKLTAAAAGNTALSTFMTAMPYLAIGALVLSALAKSGETRQGAGYQVNDGRALLGGGPSGGAINRALETKLVQQTYDTINATLKALGSTVSVASFQAGLESSTKGRGATFAGGTLSSGASFGQVYDPAIYTQTLTAEQAATQFGTKLGQSALLALQAAGDTLPAYVKRQLDTLDVSSLDANGAQQAIAAIADLPNVLAQKAGIASGDIINQLTQGILNGNIDATGEVVAGQIVASIEASMVGTAAAQIYDTFNRAIIAPVIDSIIAGQLAVDVINEATVDAAVNKAIETAAALGQVLNDPRIQEALAQLKDGLAKGFGQAGQALGFTSRYQPTTATQDPVAKAAEDDAKRQADSLKALQREWKQLQAQLLTLQGDSKGAAAVLKELATEGMGALEIAAYEANEVLRTQIQQAQKMASAMGVFDSIAADFLSGDALRNYRALRIQERLRTEGFDISVSQILATSVQDFSNLLKELAVTAPSAAASLIGFYDAIKQLQGDPTAIARNATDAALAGTERAINAERTLTQTRIDGLREQEQALQSLFDLTKSAASDLLGTGSGAKTQALKARDFIAQAAFDSLNGKLPDAENLSGAITDARRVLETSNYASRYEFERDRLILAGQLTTIREATGDQLEDTKDSIRIAETQLKVLETSLQTARDQVSALRGVDTSVLGVKDAITKLQQAITAERTATAMPFTNPATGQGAGSLIGASVSGNQAEVMASGLVRFDSPTRGTNLLWATGIVEYLNARAKDVGDANAIAEAAYYGITADLLEEIKARSKVAPKFASGGFHSGGWAMVGEQGPELAYMPPAHIYSNRDTKQLLAGNQAAQIEQMGSVLRALVKQQARTAKILERWDGDGMPTERADA